MCIFVRPHRSTTYVDAAYSYRPSSVVCRSVGLSVTLVSPAKTAEPIEITFGLWARMGLRNRVLDGSPEMLTDVAMTTNFGTKIAITCFVRKIATRQLVMKWVWVVGQQIADIANTLHLRDVAMATIFWLSIYGVHTGATWRIRLHRPCA